MLLVPKNDGGGGGGGGGARPVINLKALNSFIFNSHFRMEDLHLLKDLLREREREREGERESNFMSKVDLKDVYFCVPLYRNHQTFLRFQ